jgi:hypothetical protein
MKIQRPYQKSKYSCRIRIAGKVLRPYQKSKSENSVNAKVHFCFFDVSVFRRNISVHNIFLCGIIAENLLANHINFAIAIFSSRMIAQTPTSSNSKLCL